MNHRVRGTWNSFPSGLQLKTVNFIVFNFKGKKLALPQTSEEYFFSREWTEKKIEFNYSNIYRNYFKIKTVILAILGMKSSRKRNQNWRHFFESCSEKIMIHCPSIHCVQHSYFIDITYILLPTSLTYGQITMKAAVPVSSPTLRNDVPDQIQKATWRWRTSVSKVRHIRKRAEVKQPWAS